MRYNIRKFHYQDGVQIRVYNIPVEVGKDRKYVMEEEPGNGTLSGSDNLSGNGRLKEVSPEANDRSIHVSMNRSKQMIYGIAHANEWHYFLTLTFDRKKVDSSDYSLVVRKSRFWLENIRKRISPGIKYLIVPELHSDKVHWHMHGLLADCPELTLSDSGYKTASGLTIYNLQNWRYGFSTLTKVTHNHKVSAYISKYITKDMAAMLKGRQRYWCSNNVVRPMEVCEHDFLEKPSSEIIHDFSLQADHIKTVTSDTCHQTITYIEVNAHGE